MGAEDYKDHYYQVLFPHTRRLAPPSLPAIATTTVPCAGLQLQSGRLRQLLDTRGQRAARRPRASTAPRSAAGTSREKVPGKL